MEFFQDLTTFQIIVLFLLGIIGFFADQRAKESEQRDRRILELLERIAPSDKDYYSEE